MSLSLLHQSVEFKNFDTRLIERNVERGLITREQVKQFLNSLPDDTEQAHWVSVESLDGDFFETDFMSSESRHSH